MSGVKLGIKELFTSINPDLKLKWVKAGAVFVHACGSSLADQAEEHRGASSTSVRVPSAAAKGLACFPNRSLSFPHLPVTFLAFMTLIFQ